MRLASKIFVGVLMMLSVNIVMAAPKYAALRDTILRERPSFLAADIVDVRNQDIVEQIDVANDWLLVRAVGGRQGWVHRSTMKVFDSGAEPIRRAHTAPRHIIPSAQARQPASSMTQASPLGGVLGNLARRGVPVLPSVSQPTSSYRLQTADSTTLAGKGFGNQAQISTQATTAREYGYVDRMLARRVAPSKVNDFSRRGALAERQVQYRVTTVVVDVTYDQ